MLVMCVGDVSVSVLVMFVSVLVMCVSLCVGDVCVSVCW